MDRVNVLMGISADIGVVAWLQTNEKLVSSVFKHLLVEIAKRVPRAAILMDGARYHDSKESLRQAG